MAPDEGGDADFRALFERSPVGMYRTTPAGDHLLANQALLDLMGFASLEALRATNLESGPFPPNYSRADFKERLAREGRILALEATWTRHDGSSVEVRETVQAVRNGAGEVIYYEGVVENITAEKEARGAQDRLEQRHQRVVDHVRDGILMDDLSGRVVFANKAFVDMFGLSREELAGLTLEDYVAPEWRTALRDRHDRRVRGETVPSVFEYVGVRKDGTRIDLEVSVVEVVEDGVRVGTQSVIRDISERREMERRAIRSQRMEALGQLAGGIAHDFNNILMALTNYPAFISAQLGPGHPAQPHLVALREAAERAAVLTRQLLTFSRNQIVRARKIDIDATIRSFLPMMQRLMGENISVEYACRAPAGHIQADPSQLEQIVLNLVLNARDAMPSGGTIRIDVELSIPTEELGPQVLVRVSDEGEGIAEADLPKIFQPFYTTKPSGKGTGLGLASVLAAVQRAGGRAEVKSVVGKGTTFFIWFPLAGGSSDRIAVAPDVGATPSLRILVVEDDPIPRRVLTAALKNLGHTVMVASGGEEALVLVDDATTPIGLVISDLVMPGMSGSDLVRRIKAVRPEVPILIMSGYAPGDLPEQVAGLGLPFLEKPFTQTSLARALAEVLEPKRA